MSKHFGQVKYHMCDPLKLGGKKSLGLEYQAKNVRLIFRNNRILFVSLALTIFVLMLRLWTTQPAPYAHAYVKDDRVGADRIKSPLLVENSALFQKNADGKIIDMQSIALEAKQRGQESMTGSGQFAQKLYEIVGDAPIREMIPFISRRDEKVAAFLVGIAKKESSFGSRSPLKDGRTCYNYWGYKGSAGNGSSMGYACFASAEEAVEKVGNRIEVLVGKNRNTPARMVDTWKCGTSCAEDPGASSWVSTVALYFNKIVS